MSSTEATEKAVHYLRQASTIRMRCNAILRLGREGKLRHFKINDEALDLAAKHVADITLDTYPDLKVPYHSRWRHFYVDGIDRAQDFKDLRDPKERGRVLTELVIASVLLDAGAGDRWVYADPRSGKSISRSEGLAIASLQMFRKGLLSADIDQPYRVDSSGLKNLTVEKLGEAFQHRSDNPLVGIEGRVALMKSLGKALATNPKYFGEEGRLGLFYDHLMTLESRDCVKATDVLQSVLRGFSEIWPGREQIDGINLGDVWRHPAMKSEDLTSELIPFHKLSQWLTYSLLEPLEQSGLQVTNIDGLTGLPEYRNGGLLLDAGVLRPQYQDILTNPFSPGDEVIVEWRALTVALLDEIAPRVRQHLGVADQEFPLAKVLQGGTWNAGRRLAAEKRPGGKPPITIISDGTVF